MIYSHVLNFLGIEVRTNHTTFYMHHKFVIIDGTKMMTGSFNWSKNAMLGNNENILFVRDKEIMKKYQDTFDELWLRFGP